MALLVRVGLQLPQGSLNSAAAACEIGVPENVSKALLELTSGKKFWSLKSLPSFPLRRVFVS